MAIRGIRQGVPGGYILGRKSGARGSVGLLPITTSGQIGTGASGTATAGGFVPQTSQPNGNLAFNNAGVWSASSAYNPGDVVTYNGGAYVNYVAVSAPGPNPSPDMDDTHWFSQGVVNTVDSNFTVSAGQLQLHTIASGDVLGNSGASTAEPTAATLTAMIDRAFGSTEGQILQRGASGWQVLAPGSANQSLLSGGAGALNAWGPPVLSALTNSLSGDVALNNTANYFDGPSVAQGTSGTWFASGSVTVNDTAFAADFLAKLWDGTTVIASCVGSTSATAFLTTISLSGFIANPAGNIRISVNDSTSTSGHIKFNVTGNSKDSTITAIRIG